MANDAKIRRKDLPEISVSELARLLAYDSDTGQFTWNGKRGRAGQGTIAGKLQSKGYVYIRIHGRDYGAHRLAWLYHYGRLPASALDHINGDKTDNRIANLREATAGQNNHCRRRSRMAASGFVGVKHRSYGWEASLKHRGIEHYLGIFQRKEDAAAAYESAALLFYGEFALTNPSG